MNSGDERDRHPLHSAGTALMRSSTDYDVGILWKIAQKIVAILPELASLHCALDLISKRLTDPPLPCWAVKKEQTSFTIGDWQGATWTCTLLVVWYRPRVAQLQMRIRPR